MADYHGSVPCKRRGFLLSYQNAVVSLTAEARRSNAVIYENSTENAVACAYCGYVP